MLFRIISRVFSIESVVLHFNQLNFFSLRVMAASKLLYEIVGDVTECPICTEVIVDSKVLPCIHTFCLKCLEQFWKDKKPGDQVPCLTLQDAIQYSRRRIVRFAQELFRRKVAGCTKSIKHQPISSNMWYMFQCKEWRMMEFYHRQWNTALTARTISVSSVQSCTRSLKV